MSSAEQLLLGFEHEVASGLEDFMPAPCNRDGAGLARALARLAGGGAGAARAPGLRQEPSGPDLGGAGRRAPARSHGAAVLGRGRDPPAAAVLDPAEPIADELALLQLYNRMREQGGHLLLTARQPVAAWPLALPDLASRLRALPAVAIGAPDDALLAALLVKLFDDRQLTVSEGVIGYLIRHMERSFAAARAVVEALDRRSLRKRRPVTVALARAVLEPEDASAPSGR